MTTKTSGKCGRWRRLEVVFLTVLLYSFVVGGQTQINDDSVHFPAVSGWASYPRCIQECVLPSGSYHTTCVPAPQSTSTESGTNEDVECGSQSVEIGVSAAADCETNSCLCEAGNLGKAIEYLDTCVAKHCTQDDQDYSTLGKKLLAEYCDERDPSPEPTLNSTSTTSTQPPGTISLSSPTVPTKTTDPTTSKTSDPPASETSDLPASKTSDPPASKTSDPSSTRPDPGSGQTPPGTATATDPLGPQNTSQTSTPPALPPPGGFDTTNSHTSSTTSTQLTTRDTTVKTSHSPVPDGPASDDGGGRDFGTAEIVGTAVGGVSLLVTALGVVVAWKARAQRRKKRASSVGAELAPL